MDYIDKLFNTLDAPEASAQAPVPKDPSPIGFKAAVLRPPELSRGLEELVVAFAQNLLAQEFDSPSDLLEALKEGLLDIVDDPEVFDAVHARICLGLTIPIDAEDLDRIKSFRQELRGKDGVVRPTYQDSFFKGVLRLELVRFKQVTGVNPKEMLSLAEQIRQQDLLVKPAQPVLYLH